MQDKREPMREVILLKAVRAASKAFKKIQFAPDPDTIGKVVPIKFGKVSALYKALRAISSPAML